jgi:hypothetical protein
MQLDQGDPPYVRSSIPLLGDGRGEGTLRFLQVRRKAAGADRGAPLLVDSNGITDTWIKEVSDLSASAVVRGPWLVDDICGIAGTRGE